VDGDPHAGFVTPGETVFQDKVLMIRDPSVVNDFALLALWQLREFQLTQNQMSFLRLTTVSRTPDLSHWNQSGFDNWVLGPVRTALALGQPIPPVPLKFDTDGSLQTANAPFLAAKADVPAIPPLVPTPPDFFWAAPSVTATSPGLDLLARHRASLDACNGCHARETDTFFVHVDPASTGSQADISRFLAGTANGPLVVADPVANQITRGFDDLNRRELQIKQTSRQICARFARFNRRLVLDFLRDNGRLPFDIFEDLPLEPVDRQLSLSPDAFAANPINSVH
jgi:hypothetical protein